MSSVKYEAIAVEGGCAVFNTEAGAVTCVNGAPVSGLEHGEAEALAAQLNGTGSDDRAPAGGPAVLRRSARAQDRGLLRSRTADRLASASAARARVVRRAVDKDPSPGPAV